MTASRCTGFTLQLGKTELDDWWPMAAAIAEGVVAANMVWLRQHGVLSSVRWLDVRYDPSEPVITELGYSWPVRLAPAVLAQREGNCLDLACFEAAVLRLQKRSAIVELRAQGLTAHGYVIGDPRRRNVLFDPSKDLGS